MVPGNGFQNHLQGRVREAYPPSKHRKVKAGKTKSELKQLQLILVEAAELSEARFFVPSLKRIVKANYNQRHEVTLALQHTDELLLWAYRWMANNMSCFG